MSTWNIYHKDGSKLTDVNGEQITVHGLEYSDSWMGECFVTINLKHEVPINFQIGDYIVYRGERFELNYEPGKDKQARPDTYGEGFVYDSVKFNALQDELARAEFLDVVLNDNELHYTSLPKFPFFVQTLDDLLDRIQANLDEQIGAGLWKIYSRNKDRSVQRGALASEWLSVYGEKTEDNVIESMSITVDSQTCWQALALVNEKWDINFIVRGRNIYVGTTGIEAGHIFSYGIGNGLYEIVQNADSDQSVITRLRAYGSEKNLPSHYYADLGVKYVANITKVVTASTNVELELDIDYIETYFKNKRKYVVSGESQEQSNGWVLQVTFDFQTTITGYVTQFGSSGKCRFYSELKGGQVDSGDEESKEKLDAFIAQVNAGNTKMYITSGLNKKVVPSSMKEYAKNLPNNMSINRLMLPGFPHVSLSDFYDSLTEQEKKYVNPTGKLHKFSTDPYRPYIDSLNIEEIGLRSASQFFDTDDKTNGVIEIYPTIEEMEIGGVRVDEIDEGVATDDDGRFGDNETVKNVDIYLNKAIDFDINDLKDDDFSISMKDGMCGGRTFKVASSAKVDGRWRLTIERIKDDALELWFPYKDYPIKNGDHFVLTGITLPDSYVKAASLKLLKYAIALLDKNDYTRYVYQPKVDELFMARQHDKAQADETGTIKSLHDTLKAGDLMNFNDTDLNIEGIISIDQLTIKEEDGNIPTYDITLREDKEVGTIQKIQQQISSLQSGNGGAGLTTTQVKNQVATEGSKHFISKINDDIAKGTITWEKIQKLLSGLVVGNSNNENGGSWTPDAEGRSHLITDYLEVRMKAIFEELVIKKTSTIGGKEILSPAGGVVAHKVEEVTVTYNNVSQKAYRCYFLAEQEGDAVDNDFAIGDQVRSESFNVRKGTYHKVGNHFYWRLVIGRNEDPVELEGKKYHYIDLSDTDCATASDVPAKGDVLSQCGNRTDVERQNCLIFSAVDTYSPFIGLYHGINSYSFANKEYVEYGVNKQTNKAFFNVYGDSYIGDKEGTSFFQYDSKKKEATFKGKMIFNSDSQLPDGSSVNDIAKKKDLNIKSGNLLRNTSFCGDYESIDISEDVEISEDKETFSEKQKCWTMENASIIDIKDSTSGKAVWIGHKLSQQLAQPLLSGKAYVLSFKGKGTTVKVSIGGETHDVTMTSSFERYELHITCSDAKDAVFDMVSTNCTVCEIMLSYGTIAPAWSPSYSDNDKSMAEFQNLKFLTDAISQGSTTIDGGLVMSQLFKVGNYRDKKMIKETGGMSGYYNDNDSPFLWGGGTLEQAIYTIQKYKDNPNYEPTAEELNNLAKFVVTHGGRAILTDIILRGIIYAEGGVMKSIKSPNGNFEIDNEGNAKLKKAVVESLSSVGGYFKDVSISGNIYTPYTIIDDGNKMQYGGFGLDWVELYYKLDLSLSGFNIQIGLPKTTKPVFIQLPEDEKYLGAEVNIFCTYRYIGLKNVSYVNSYDFNSAISFETRYPIIYQGQIVKLKCVKIANAIRWIVERLSDTIYPLSTAPKLIAMYQVRYDAEFGIYRNYGITGTNYDISGGFSDIEHVSTGVHDLSYKEGFDMIEPFAFDGMVGYSIDTENKKVRIFTYDRAGRTNDVPFGYKVYSGMSRIDNYIKTEN